MSRLKIEDARFKKPAKIAIASSGETLEAKVDARFGRCPYFLIVNTKTNKFEVLENTAGQAFQGAGISAAQMIVNKKVKAVLAGNFGPKAVYVLNNSGIKIFSVSSVSVKEALAGYKKGDLKEVDVAAAPFGMSVGRGMK
jgi:predicted Fe-Mo cluster-binding NifX family protein